ncbi:hypothetical protein CRE_24291 [Caenorhabditis remanei]|uniref:F-box domain-containing protein n=1 Tax=Caenorhabditis remanei TaxID=31234 RepID=E3NLC0_CAERE|nr:hypothetical protein CRE_24291 [Caenorhabditis remanei]
MSSPFLFLRLPGVVLCKKFKSLSIVEKFKLSLCSNKISTQINNDRFYCQKVQMCVDVTNQRIDIFSGNVRDWVQIGIHLDREINNPTV